MEAEILKSLSFNISLLVLAAHVLTKLSPVKRFVTGDGDGVVNRLFMCLLFGLIGIFSTYAGVPVEGAIANTRVIGVIIGGLLGARWWVQERER